MNLDLILVIIFYFLLYCFYLKNKNKFEVQNKIFILYKTKLGLNLMDKLSNKIPKTLNILSYFSILLGFLGMAIIFYFLIIGAIKTYLQPSAPPSVVPLLPGINIPGAPELSFFHWIFAILIIAIIHEFSHGVYSRLNNIKVKSSGFAFIGPILAAFVEPDEKELESKSKKAQLSVLSAGPFSNIISGLIVLLLITSLLAPLDSFFYEPSGLVINELLPSSNIKISTPFIIKQVNNYSLNSLTNIAAISSTLKPNEDVNLTTDKGTFIIKTIEDPSNSSKGLLGINLINAKIKTNIKNNIQEKYGTFIPSVAQWITLLFIWIFIISLGVGLFNLLPFGPVDGGRMFYLLALFITKRKSSAKKLWAFVSLTCLFLIFINLLPWLNKIITSLIKYLLFLISLF